MRFLMPLSVFVAVAAFHYALSASLDSAEKQDVLALDDALTKLQKIDQVEFEAAQKADVAQKNVTEEHSDDTRYHVEELTEAAGSSRAQEAPTSDTLAESESSSEEEEVEGRQEKQAETTGRADKDSQDLTKEQDVLE